MATKMDMSLDDIITTTKSRRGRGGGRGGGRGTGGGARRGGAGRGTGNRPGGQRTRGAIGGGGGARRGGATRGFRSGTARGSNADAGVWTHDKFQDSLGGGARKAVSTAGARVTGPAKITISNLHYGVSDSDIIELFGELGNIRYASVHYDRSGRSMGKADVTFERRAEAQAAINQYNNVPLDGRPMQIAWATAPAATTQQQVSPRGSNLRQIQGKRIGRTSGGGGGGGFRGGRGRGGGARGGGGGRGGKAGQTKPPTAEQLDAELEAYVSNRV